jgi:hypothetical protein
MWITSEGIEREHGGNVQPLNRYDVAALMLQYWWMVVVLGLLLVSLTIWV